MFVDVCVGGWVGGCMYGLGRCVLEHMHAQPRAVSYLRITLIVTNVDESVEANSTNT